jgi:CXXX repeat peptide maturase
MINYLILLVSENSKSFCYYESLSKKTGKTDIINFDLLKKSVLYAIKNKLGLNILYGDKPLPDKYEKELDKIEHIKILPIKLRKYYKKGIYIIEEADLKNVKKIKKNNELNLILRISKKLLPQLSEIFKIFLWKFKKLNLIFTDIDKFSENDFLIYKEQIKIIEKQIYNLFIKGNHLELNFLTDRLFLQNMNNCDAGIKHLTIAPDGKFYLCPGFYYESRNNSLGTLDENYSIVFDELLKLKNSPICSNCDAWHCKRCFYLSKKITSEINIPSSKQCKISHIERNQTGILSDKLRKKSKSFKNLIPIPEVNYIDPFELLKAESGITEDEKITVISELLSKPLERLSVKELLMHLYSVDKEAIIKLKNYLYSKNENK